MIFVEFRKLMILVEWQYFNLFQYGWQLLTWFIPIVFFDFSILKFSRFLFFPNQWFFQSSLEICFFFLFPLRVIGSGRNCDGSECLWQKVPHFGTIPFKRVPDVRLAIHCGFSQKVEPKLPEKRDYFWQKNGRFIQWRVVKKNTKTTMSWRMRDFIYFIFMIRLLIGETLEVPFFLRKIDFSL